MNFIKDVSLTSKSILLRCDFNIPVKNGQILDNSRIIASLETIKYLLSLNTRVIICSHFGNPKEFLEEFSLKIVAKELEKLLDTEVIFIQNITNPDSITKVHSLPYGSLIMLENLRFYPEEIENDDKFAKILSNYANIFINEAFSCSHRKHASISAVTNHIPAFAGFNMKKEIDFINNFLSVSEGNLSCIIGGSKISTKMGLLRNLTSKCNLIFLCGGIANTFLVATDKKVGLSFYEKEYVDNAREIIQLCHGKCELILPQDVQVSKSTKIPVNSKICSTDEIKNDDIIVDVGPKTLSKIDSKLQKLKYLIWNGPLGIYENKPFDTGSIHLAKLIAYETAKNNLISVIGGGDAAACIKLSGLSDQFSFVSTAGGAFLEYIQNNNLPGIEPLYKKIDF